MTFGSLRNGVIAVELIQTGGTLKRVKRAMFLRCAALLLVASGHGLVACGGNTTPALPKESGSSGDAAGEGMDAASFDATAPGQGGDAAPGAGPPPHRAASMACAPTTIPSDPTIPDAGLVPGANFACHVNADCTQGKQGRCVLYQATTGPSGVAGSQCAYDQCLTDTDCPDGGVCSCDGNSCLAGNCRVDSDCASGKFCSPNEDPCSSPPNAVLGYFCHTASDQCTSDSDCDPTKFEKVCSFDATAHRWTCPQNAGCAQ